MKTWVCDFRWSMPIEQCLHKQQSGAETSWTPQSDTDRQHAGQTDMILYFFYTRLIISYLQLCSSCTWQQEQSSYLTCWKRRIFPIVLTSSYLQWWDCGTFSSQKYSASSMEKVIEKHKIIALRLSSLHFYRTVDIFSICNFILHSMRKVKSYCPL